MDKQFCLQQMREQISEVKRDRRNFGYAMGFLSGLASAEVITDAEREALKAELMAARDAAE